VVEALCYKPEVQVIEFVSVYLNPSSRIVALGLTQPVTEMSKARPARKADNLTATLEPIF
jgi:hypothetical protein